jgi:hypothetical protein
MQVSLCVFSTRENLPQVSERVATQRTDWASSRKEARYLGKLCHLLGQLSQSDLELFISVVQRVGSKEQ